MSTEIGILYSTMKDKHTQLHINRFYGGKENGVCVQLTNQDGHFIQLNTGDLLTLIPILEEYIINFSESENLPNFQFEFSDEIKPKSTNIFKKMLGKIKK